MTIKPGIEVAIYLDGAQKYTLRLLPGQGVKIKIFPSDFQLKTTRVKTLKKIYWRGSRMDFFTSYHPMRPHQDAFIGPWPFAG